MSTALFTVFLGNCLTGAAASSVCAVQRPHWASCLLVSDTHPYLCSDSVMSLLPVTTFASVPGGLEGNQQRSEVDVLLREKKGETCPLENALSPIGCFDH